LICKTKGNILQNYFSIFTTDRNLRWLAGLILAQVLLIFIVFWPSDTQTKGELLFVDRADVDITELQLVDVEGEHMNLSKRENDWAMSNADDFFVSIDKVQPLITKLLELKTDRLVATTDNSHINLEVSSEKYKRKIYIEWSDGTNDTILLGNSAGSGATHFRLMSQDEVYLTASLTTWDANTTPSRYIDTQYFVVEKEDIVSIELKNEHGRFVLEKHDGKWLYDGLKEGEIFNQSAMDTFLVQASSIRMTSPLGKSEKESYGFDNPQAVLSVVFNSGGEVQQHTIRVGSQFDDDYVVSASNSEYYALVSSYNGGNLAQKMHSDFVETTSDEE